MPLVVKHAYLPGFTDAKRNPELEAYLTLRGYDKGEGQEGAEIAHIFHGRIMDAGISLAAGAEGFDHLGQMRDDRNKIIASCARHNCMSAIWWLVESEGERKWTLYSGCWNDELAFMVLDAPSFHPWPVVWLTAEQKAVRPLLDLNSV